MPSTYSNIKIQLMATGENNTTWGNVTNINLGTALEEAIVGSADVTFASGNVTLTLTDTNASQPARHMRLHCVGVTGGATRNLIVPSIEKPYIVQNDCADSVVIKTAAGTGVTVPAGKTLWVYNDGVNVLDVTSHLSSLTLSTALPVASGGTGSNTASGARTNLGLGTMSTQNANSVSITGGSITGITDLAVADGGTGVSSFTANGVLYGNNSSALLVTAAGTTGQVLVGNTGGAPSWATLTGIGVTSFSGGTTGLTPASPTTGAITLAGTLGVANGGTGTATQFTAGSVVFAGASGVYSQDNANLFWDNANDRLGIGTATPTTTLAVNGQTRSTSIDVIGSLASFAAAGGLTNYYNGSGIGVIRAYSDGAGAAGTLTFNASGSENMRITGSGNVGLGTNNPATWRMYMSQTGSDLLTLYNSSATGVQLAMADQGWQGGVNMTNGNLILQAGGITERMRIDGSGNVGIGTSSPGTRLDVSGGDTYRISRVSTATGGIIEMGLLGQSIIGIQSLTNASNFQSLILNPNGGNVGIGTSTPGARLDVRTSLSATTGVQNIADFYPITSGNTDATYGGRITLFTKNLNGNYWPAAIAALNDAGGSNLSSLGFYTATAGQTLNERMRIDSSGNVGIGTTSPTNAKLKVSGNATGAIMSEDTSGSFVRILGDASSQNLINWQDGTALRFATSNQDYTTFTERMRIDSGGNVGIGTSSPGQRLTVAGNILTSSAAGTDSYVNVTTSGIQNTLLGFNNSGATNAFGAANNYTYVGNGNNYGVQIISNGSPAVTVTNTLNVGIGTSSPSARLDLGAYTGPALGTSMLKMQDGWHDVITSSAVVGSRYYYGASIYGRSYADVNGFNIDTSSTSVPIIFGTAGTERMRISGAGIVGIGVAPSANDFTGTLQTGWVGHGITPRTSTNLVFNMNANHNAGDWRYGNTGAAALYIQSDTGHAWYNAPSGTAGNVIAFTEAMRITSAGNVGIGISAPNAKLDVVGGASQRKLQISGSAFGTTIADVYIGRTGVNSAGLAQAPSLQFGNDTDASGVILQGSNQFQIWTNNAGAGWLERFRINSAGDVGIGTTSPGYRLDVSGAVQATDYRAPTTNVFYLTGDEWRFRTTGGTERARIDTSGNLLVGTTGDGVFSARMRVDGSQGAAFVCTGGAGNSSTFMWNTATSGDNTFAVFYTEASVTARGSITYNRGAGLVAYNTTSDYRAKDILGPVENSGGTIDALKVYDGKMKGATIERPMLIAHEAQEVVPYAVTGEKDAVNKDGTPKFQQIDVSSLVPLLIAEIQSLRARVAQLEGK